MAMSDAEREVLEQIKRIGIIPLEVGDGAALEFPSSDDSTSGSGRAAPATRVARALEAGKLITSHQAKSIAGGNADELSYGGQYVREDLLGQGGMGSVYRARHRMMDRAVALKTIRFDQFENAEVRSRFLREVRASGRIMHPNLVVAFDAGERNNELYLVMEFIEGTNLHELVRELGPLPWPRACELMAQAALGLAHAHERGIVHRDIKPGNIMLTADGVIKILDLGLARLADGCDTMTDGWIGTVDYSSPEQCDDARHVDHRSDIYSLACTLYFLIVGQAPFADVKGLKAKLLAHYGRSAPRLQAARPDVPDVVEALFQRMMAKAPDDRPQSMKDVASSLNDCRTRSQARPKPSREPRPEFDPRPQSTSPPPPPPEPMARHVDAEVDSPHHWVEPDSERSRRWALGAAIIAIGVVLVVLGWMVVSNLGPQRGESVVSTPPPPTTSKSPPKSNRPSEAEPKSTGAVASGLSPKSQAESNTSSEIASNAGPLMSDAEKPASPAPLIKTQSVPKGDSQPSAKSRPDPPAPVPIPFAGREAGEIRDDNSLKTKLVWCPPGSFRMGSPKNEPDRSSDEDQVDVTLKSGVWLGQCEVTQAEWQAVMGTTIRDQAEKGTIVKTLVGEGPNYPMYYVSHDEAREFCRKLSDRERAAGRLPAGCEYRLPTEAEWEYGCRAGTMTATAFGAKLSSRQANFDGDSPYNGAEKGPDLSKTQEVGRYPSNPWKLHDMHGNVWEWCLDAYKTELPGGVDPFASGAGSVEDRVSRGGGWGSGGGLCRSAYRYGFTSDYRVNYLGFRLSLGPSRN